MNFTREPVIETVITPREGCKLLVRSSKSAGQEEYYVDAVEVVSFGHSLFFRSSEKPKSFLVPVSDYEILELKEVRMALKNATPERSIKIGGGREGSVRPVREGVPMEPAEPMDLQNGDRPPMERDRKRDKRRRGRRGSGRSEGGSQEMRGSYSSEEGAAPSGEDISMDGVRSEEPKAPSFISKLFPPPPTLIKETLSRYKLAEMGPEGEFSSTDEKFSDVIFEVPPPPVVESDTEENETFED